MTEGTGRLGPQWAERVGGTGLRGRGSASEGAAPALAHPGRWPLAVQAWLRLHRQGDSPITVSLVSSGSFRGPGCYIIDVAWTL